MVNLWDILRALVPLIIVIGLLYAILRYLRKFYNPGGAGPSVAKYNVKVLSTQMIMPKKYVSVLKIQDKIFIVGIADNSISLLKELEADAADSNIPGITPEKNSFVDLLRKNLSLK